MGVRVEKYIPELGLIYDEYPMAGSWFIAASGEMQIYIGRPEDDDYSALIAEYGAGQFIRAFREPVPQPDEIPHLVSKIDRHEEESEQ